MTELRISSDLQLPIDAALGRFVILGKSGAGKTNGDAVLIEEFVRAGVPTIVLDPLGNMHGLRSTYDGEGAGLPIAVFGGEHGDLPLPPERAAYVADQLSEGVSAVLDMLAMDPDDQVRFASEFLERLIQRTKTNLHVVLEEADRFAPNKIGRNPVVMFARTCRNMGIGWTFSTQRPQILNHAVVDSASVFIAMRMTGELAQEAIGGEIGSRIGKKTAAAMMADLPTFKRGEAWFVPDSDWLGDETGEWSPRRFRFRLRGTFEVRPPRIGEGRHEPKVLADVDLAALRAALTADDVEEPEEAKVVERIVEVERIVDRPVLAAEQVDALHAIVAAIQSVDEAYDRLRQDLEPLHGILEIVREFDGHELVAPQLETAPASTDAAPSTNGHAVVRPERVPKTKAPSEPGAPVAGGPMKVLIALARTRAGRATRVQLGVLAGYSPNAGGFRNNLSSLRGAGLIEDLDGSVVAITEEGRRRAGPVRSAVSTSDVHALWRGKLDGGPRKVLDVLLEVYPRGLSRDDLAERAGYVASAGGFRNNLSALRTTDLIDERDRLVFASAALFPTGGAR